MSNQQERSDLIEALAHERERVDELVLCATRLQKDRDLLQAEVYKLREKIKNRIIHHPSVSTVLRLCNKCKKGKK